VDADEDEYLEWLRDLLYPDRVELLDGELFVSRAPDPEHQSAVLRLGAWLLQWADATGLAWVWPGNVAVKLAIGENDVEPDVVLLRRDNPRARYVRRNPAGRRRRDRRGYIGGTPDLLVEVISPSHEPRDRVQKRDIYARAGVANYWVMDFVTRIATCYHNPKGGTYRESETIPWEELRWPPEGGERWGDSPTFPRPEA
jgi:Uma2 family endonuclease